MNILPHKSWHVRTKANIARVRKDQAKAAEEEAEKQRKISLAECEARVNLLRRKKDGTPSETLIYTNIPEEEGESTNACKVDDFPAGQHIELFSDFKDKITTAKPMDEEKRIEQEKYEKQIGYLTYLGQDTHEALGTRNWYDLAPKRRDTYDEDGRKIEVGFKTKERHDPMRIFLSRGEHRPIKPVTPSVNAATESTPAVSPTPALAVDISLNKRLKYTPIMPAMKRIRSESEDESRPHKRKKKDKEREKHKKKKKKHKKESRREDRKGEKIVKVEKVEKVEKVDSIALLREKRLRREAEEKLRANELLLAKFPPVAPPEIPTRSPKKLDPLPYVKQKYNSQFNPELAKQNYG